jgi:alkylated DNA repair protein alkB family protein 6
VSHVAVPSWLTRITDRICQWTGLFPSAINHVLINEYHPNQGIMVCIDSSLQFAPSLYILSIVLFLQRTISAFQPHQDGPAYYPVVAIISLASPVVIDFTPHKKLKEQEHTDPQNIQTDELPGPSKMESNGSGSHECGNPNESDPASSSLMLMPCSLLIFKDQAYTG